VAEAALSDESGRYQLINLRPGQYKLRCYIPGGHVYYEGEKAGKPESRREPESQGARKPIILQVERGKTLKNIDFRFHQFKKGTWRHYGISDGLASMSVNDICLASDGTLWFSTGSRDWIIGSGVSRYDGQKFVNFTTKDGLVHNAVKSIYCDQDGVMWFGTYGGVSRYDGEKFVNFTTADGLPNNWVYSIHSTPDGTLWFGQWEVLTNRGGISRYEKPLRPSATLRDGEEFVNFTTEDGLAHNCVYAIHSTPDGVLWFGTEGGVSRYDARGMGDSPHFVNFTMKDGLVHNSVWAIHGDSDGIMWFGTEGGVSRYDGNGFVNFTREYGLMDNGVEAIYGSADGSLWFGSQHGGVSRYDERTFTILTEDDGLAHNMVRAIHSASDGVLWLGTKGGVSRYDGKDFVNFTRENGLAADDVGVIHRDADGALWFGTGDLGTSWGGGVSRYDPAAEKVGSERFVNFTIRDGLAANGVFAIHSAPDGTLWFGTRDGVSRYDGKELVNVNREIGLGLDGYRMTASCIHIVSDDILWLGGYDVLRRYDGKELVNFTTQDGLADDFILAIHDDHDGALWIATYGGISRCDGRSMGDSPHFLNFTAEDGLAGNQMGTIYAEPDGTLWFGGDGGISGYDGVAWTSLDGRDGLAGNRVYSIEQDPDGNFWIGTDKGLIHYRRSKTKPKVRIVSVTTDETYVDLSAIPPLVVGSRVTIEYNSIDFKTIPEKRQYRVRIIKIPPAPLW
ncbi:hypothetical protein H8E77_10080, partial [bacterium]|nr:hypothetical protein [bacterium]